MLIIYIPPSNLGLSKQASVEYLNNMSSVYSTVLHNKPDVVQHGCHE